MEAEERQQSPPQPQPKPPPRAPQRLGATPAGWGQLDGCLAAASRNRGRLPAEKKKDFEGFRRIRQKEH